LSKTNFTFFFVYSGLRGISGITIALRVAMNFALLGRVLGWMPKYNGQMLLPSHPQQAEMIAASFAQQESTNNFDTGIIRILPCNNVPRNLN
jgi:hypothetical protein